MRFVLLAPLLFSLAARAAPVEIKITEPDGQVKDFSFQDIPGVQFQDVKLEKSKETCKITFSDFDTNQKIDGKNVLLKRYDLFCSPKNHETGFGTSGLCGVKDTVGFDVMEIGKRKTDKTLLWHLKMECD